MIIPDANILIYAYDRALPQHQKAKAWLEGALSGSEPVGIPWVVLLAFTRIMTHPHICQNPLSIGQVRTAVQQWLNCPHVRPIHPSEQASEVFFDLLEESGLGGNLSTDALIALHAREHSATLYTNDRDFDRFAGIKWINPLK